jgi:hypothetical protein
VYRGTPKVWSASRRSGRRPKHFCAASTSRSCSFTYEDKPKCRWLFIWDRDVLDLREQQTPWRRCGSSPGLARLAARPVQDRLTEREAQEKAGDDGQLSLW